MPPADVLTPEPGRRARRDRRDAPSRSSRKPTVAILSTGNEIVEPGQPLAPGQIYDINRFTLAAVVARHGGVAGGAADRRRHARRRSRPALDAARAPRRRRLFRRQLGGRSRSDSRRAARSAARCIFHGVAVKPGKPTAFGTDRRARRCFGMPGYPTSCLSNAYMLLVPFLRKIARLPPWQPRHHRRCRSPAASSRATGRHQFYTVRVVDGHAEPAFKASGDITSMANADGYIEIPAQTDVVEAGTVVTVKLF